MKNILELNSKDAKKFFLKKESYTSLELPNYFNFQDVIDKLETRLGDKKTK